jgi:hypothetical protein
MFGTKHMSVDYVGAVVNVYSLVLIGDDENKEGKR